MYPEYCEDFFCSDILRFYSLYCAMSAVLSCCLFLSWARQEFQTNFQHTNLFVILIVQSYVTDMTCLLLLVCIWWFPVRGKDTLLKSVGHMVVNFIMWLSTSKSSVKNLQQTRIYLEKGFNSRYVKLGSALWLSYLFEEIYMYVHVCTQEKEKSILLWQKQFFRCYFRLNETFHICKNAEISTKWESSWRKWVLSAYQWVGKLFRKLNTCISALAVTNI